MHDSISFFCTFLTIYFKWISTIAILFACKNQFGECSLSHYRSSTLMLSISSIMKEDSVLTYACKYDEMMANRQINRPTAFERVVLCKGVVSSLLNVYPVPAIYQVLATLALIMGFIRQYRSIFRNRWNLHHHDPDSPEPVACSCTSTAMILLEIYHSLSGPAVICHKCKFESARTKLRRSRYRHVIIDQFSVKIQRNL